MDGQWNTDWLTDWSSEPEAESSADSPCLPCDDESCFACTDDRCTALESGYDDSCSFFKLISDNRSGVRDGLLRLMEEDRFDLMRTHGAVLAEMGAFDQEMEQAKEFQDMLEKFREEDLEEQKQKKAKEIEAVSLERTIDLLLDSIIQSQREQTEDASASEAPDDELVPEVEPESKIAVETALASDRVATLDLLEQQSDGTSESTEWAAAQTSSADIYQKGRGIPSDPDDDDQENRWISSQIHALCTGVVERRRGQFVVNAIPLWQRNMDPVEEGYRLLGAAIMLEAARDYTIRFRQVRRLKCMDAMKIISYLELDHFFETDYAWKLMDMSPLSLRGNCQGRAERLEKSIIRVRNRQIVSEMMAEMTAGQ